MVCSLQGGFEWPHTTFDTNKLTRIRFLQDRDDIEPERGEDKPKDVSLCLRGC